MVCFCYRFQSRAGARYGVDLKYVMCHGLLSAINHGALHPERNSPFARILFSELTQRGEEQRGSMPVENDTLTRRFS